MNAESVTILVVDDTPQNIKVLDAILSPRGYRVVTARSGAEALQKVRDEAPDLVLLDILMPGMSGYEVVQRLRDDPVTRVLPIVMVTALGAQEEKVKAIEAGADDFLTKPVNQLELLARVKSLLRIKEYHDTIQSQAAELAERVPDNGRAYTPCPSPRQGQAAARAARSGIASATDLRRAYVLW